MCYIAERRYGCCAIGDELVVADVANHRLSVFRRSTGEFVRCIGGDGELLANPRGICNVFASPPPDLSPRAPRLGRRLRRPAEKAAERLNRSHSADRMTCECLFLPAIHGRIMGVSNSMR